MAVESTADAADVELDGKGPPQLDAELIKAYLDLQIRWLQVQIKNVEELASESQADAALGATASRLWRKAAPTVVLVILLAAAVALVAAFTWDDLWRGLFFSPSNPRYSPSQESDVVKGMGAFSNFLKDWKDAFLGLAGGGVLIAFKRLAYRSLGSALVIALGIVLAASLLSGLAIADVNLVQENLRPMHITLRGWAVLALAVLIGLLLMLELGDLAITAGPAAFLGRSSWQQTLAKRIAWFTSSTWLGRFMAWLVPPRSWGRAFATLGVLAAVSLVVCGASLTAAVVANINNDNTAENFWIAVFLLGFPLGPLWWLWFLVAVIASPTARDAAGGPIRMALFASAPILSVLAFAATGLAPASYNSIGDIDGVAAFIVLLTILVWGLWFIWAGVSLPASLRVSYLPLAICFFLSFWLYYSTLPVLALAAVLAVGVPVSLWRHHAAGLSMPPRPAGNLAS